MNLVSRNLIFTLWDCNLGEISVLCFIIHACWRVSSGHKKEPLTIRVALTCSGIFPVCDHFHHTLIMVTAASPLGIIKMRRSKEAWDRWGKSVLQVIWNWNWAQLYVWCKINCNHDCDTDILSTTHFFRLILAFYSHKSPVSRLAKCGRQVSGVWWWYDVWICSLISSGATSK